MYLKEDHQILEHQMIQHFDFQASRHLTTVIVSISRVELQEVNGNRPILAEQTFSHNFYENLEASISNLSVCLKDPLVSFQLQNILYLTFCSKFTSDFDKLQHFETKTKNGN